MTVSFAKKSVFSLVNRGYNVLFQVVTAAYISRIFFAEGVGEIMFVINIVTYFVLAASLGIPNYAVKVLAPVRDEQITLNKRFTELAVLIFISSVVASLFYYSTVSLIFNDITELKMAYALGLMVIANMFNYDWLFESVEDFKYLACRSILVRSLALLFIFTLVHSPEDVFEYCLIYSSCTILSNLLNFVSHRKYVHFIFGHLEISQHLKPVFILFAAAFATEMYTLLDSTMLGIMCPPEYLGYYSNASKAARAFFYAIFAAISVFNPSLNYIYKTGNISVYKKMLKRFYETALCIAFPSMIILNLGAPLIMTLLFGEAFSPGILTLRLMSPLLIILTMAYVFGHVCLIIYGKEKVILYAAMIGAFVNFCLNQLLIPSYAHNGAAIASIVSEFAVAVFLVINSLLVCRISLLSKKIIVMFMLSVILCVCGWIII